MLAADDIPYLDYSACGLQICSHPACWLANQQLNRELLLKHFKSQNDRLTKPKTDKFPTPHKIHIAETPSLSILNLLDEIHYEIQSPLPSLSSSSSDQSIDMFHSFKNLPTADSHIYSRLHVNPMSQGSVSGITPAPANTPRPTSQHRLEKSTTDSKDDLQISNKRSNLSLYTQSVNGVDLNFQQGRRKKIYVWKSKNKQETHLSNANKRKSNAGAVNVIMPLDTLPAHSSGTTWKSRTRTKKALHMTNMQLTVDPSKKPIKKASKLLKSDGSTQLSREIERLRLVPLDVLLRVIKMALHNKVLTSDQADILLYQVTGHKHSLQEVSGESNKTKPNLCLTSQKKFHSPRVAMPTANHQSSISSIVYKLDTSSSGLQEKIERRKSVVRSGLKKQLGPPTPADEVANLDQFLNPLKQHSAIKSTVGCVIRAPNESKISSPLPKPFHYEKSPHDPLPTPPPSAPSTERDSNYNEILGGSTVLVNPSRTPSLSSYERPPSGSSLNRSQKRNSLSNTPNDFKAGSSTKSTLWPQVDDVFYLETESEKVDVSESHDNMNILREDVVEEDTKLPTLAEGSSGANTIESSPVPPPPSPVMSHAKHDEVTNTNKVMEERRAITVEGHATGVARGDSHF